jgi:hypothetical protein
MRKHLVIAALLLVSAFVAMAGQPHRVVISNSTQYVLRHGYCDFTNDGSFDSENETVLTTPVVFDPPIRRQTWAWVSEGTTFVQTTP